MIIYLLSKFKEPKAFPLMLKITLLTEEELADNFDEVITDNPHRFLAGTYHNNFDDLKMVLESLETSIWAKHIVLFTIITLSSRGLLATDLFHDLFTRLFRYPTYSSGNDNYLSLIRSCYDLDAKYFYQNISKTFLTDKTNAINISLNITPEHLKKKAANQKHTSVKECTQNMAVIDEVIIEMKKLSCFNC